MTLSTGSNAKISQQIFARTDFFPGFKWLTLPETNIAPENKPSQKETSIPTIHFQGLC